MTLVEVFVSVASVAFTIASGAFTGVAVLAFLFNMQALTFEESLTMSGSPDARRNALRRWLLLFCCSLPVLIVSATGWVYALHNWWSKP